MHDCNGKHAYLIMAHDDQLLLDTLITLLDGERSDIFLHLDQKSSLKNHVSLQHAHIYEVKSENVQWSGESQIIAEMNLIKCAAIHGPYMYYHLLSGRDLPLKSQKEIYDFFDDNSGTEYIDIWPFKERQHQRVMKYTIQNDISKCEYHTYLNDLLIITQNTYSLIRPFDNKYPTFYAGSNWFSLTHKAICYLIYNENDIVKYFYKGYGADETFVQTLLLNSPFADNIGGSTRYIEKFEGPHPVLLRFKDKQSLVETDCLFARKFDSEKDYPIIQSIAESIRPDIYKQKKYSTFQITL